MADITWADVVGFDASMSGVDPIAQETILGYANNEALQASLFGGEDAWKYRLARIYLAAHHGELALPYATANGDVSSKTVSPGSLSVTYAGIPSGAELAMTTGGKALDELLLTTPARIFPMSVSCLP